MPLPPGTKLGPYEVLAPLGAGGMGEVYRARDTRLERSVAVKVLPPHLSSNPEIRLRFEREARTVSSLNHPHICSLYDVGHQDGIDYLVMELVDGETLAHRLERGSLPPADVLQYGIEISDALDRAHQSGIVHRDLKPGNIMLTKSRAKLMDFGLARATGLADPKGRSGLTMEQLTQSPTVAAPLTAEGTILGTFQYMAPEQLEGKESDARSDLWALGCVLYEMASGKRAFAGRSQASLIAAILEHEPTPISELRPMMPAALDRVVRACLAKDPERRIQTAHDVRLQLQWIAGEASQAGELPARLSRARRGSRARERAAWAIGIAAVAIIGFLAGRMMGGSRGNRPITFATPTPQGMTVFTPANMALSPDGNLLAFAAYDSLGASRLWIRALDSLEPRALPGTEGVIYPFWSPDSRMLGFFAGGKLKKVPAGGGPVQVLCDANSGRGGTWNRDGVILIAPSGDGPLHRVSSNGGPSAPLMALDSTRHESGQRWPCFLPDGRHFLYVSIPPLRGECQTYVASLDGKEKKPVLSSSQGAVFAPPNFLVFTRGRTVLAQRFDPGARRLSGEPTAIAELRDVSANLGEPCASTSRAGALLYLDAAPTRSRLVWFDRAGHEQDAVPVPPGPYSVVWLSPDGRQATIDRQNTPASQDILIIDLVRSTLTQLVTEPGYSRGPVWSRDGQKVFYSSNRDGPYDFFARSTTRNGSEEVVFKSNVLLKTADDVTPDGRYLVFDQYEPATGQDIWLLPLVGDRKPVPWLRTPSNENNAAVSPDGRWVTYLSNESGQFEIYVAPFAGGGSRVQVSRGGGGGNTWRSDGKEIIYSGANGIMAAEVRAGDQIDVGEPHALFKPPPGTTGWAPTPDGRRFLLGLPVDTEVPRTPTIVLNWTAGLERRH
jgi:Tol biopolymer transport system component